MVDFVVEKGTRGKSRKMAKIKNAKTTRPLASVVAYATSSVGYYLFTPIDYNLSQIL